jgi:hypothetical protein
MPSTSVHPDLVRVSLERIEGTPFERFAQEFLSAAFGTQFVPLGGMQDGGADGLFEREEGQQPDHFMQASVQADYRGKVRETVARLRSAGRTVRELTFASSQRVPKVDLVEQELSQELDLALRIRDRVYFENHINLDQRTREAFSHHLRPALAFLEHIGASPMHGALPEGASTAVYVFLRQELDRQGGDLGLLDATVDALIIWALEETDPDSGKLLSRGEILGRIENVAPAVHAATSGRLDARLDALSTKQSPGGRQVSWHRKEDRYCLSYSQRQGVQAANAADASLRTTVHEQWQEQLLTLLGTTVPDGVIRQALQVAARAIERVFERQGVEFSHFLCRDHTRAGLLTVSDAIVAALTDMGVQAANQNLVATAVQEVLRTSFYEPTPEQHEYFGRLSRTFSLLFGLQAEPRVAEYFDSLASDFYLYVGTDMLIRSLAEHYVPAQGQMVTAALRVAARAGATLVLTEPVLEEVVTHLRSSDREFRHEFLGKENLIPLEVAEQSPRILIRAFFRAQHSEAVARPPSSWQVFLNNICEYDDLDTNRAFRTVRDYLVGKFGMIYVGRAELQAMVSMRQVDELAGELAPDKAHEDLANNDALLALAVYGRRRQNGENAATSSFGFKTWWLTGETAIQRYSGRIVASEGGELYMMRPEFLINFIALAPSAAQIRRSYANVFPSTLGIRLGRQMDEKEFQRMMQDVASALELEGPRRNAQIGATVDRLKADFRRRYRVEVNAEPAHRA